jgi:hypothetical protein
MLHILKPVILLVLNETYCQRLVYTVVSTLGLWYVNDTVYVILQHFGYKNIYYSM